MRSKLCTVRFFINENLKHRDGFPIYARITYGRKKVEIATGQYCEPNKWLEEAERTKNDNHVNEQLHFIKDEIIRIKRDLERAEENISARAIKDAYLNANTQLKIVLTDYFQAYIDKIEQLHEEYTAGTVVHYKTTLKHLKAFLKAQRKEELSIAHFSHKMVNDFDFYLMTHLNPKLNKPCNRNTTNKYHTKLKSVLIRAVREDVLEVNPYRGFVLRRQKPKRTFLTQMKSKF